MFVAIGWISFDNPSQEEIKAVSSVLEDGQLPLPKGNGLC